MAHRSAAARSTPPGLGGYTVRVSRTGLADGIYTGAARFHSSAGDLDVPVIMQVGNAVTADANAGHHYVLLVDPDSGATRSTPWRWRPATAATATASRDVEPGSYYVYAGTDVDNDNFLCDRGEACGSYPTLDQPRLIAVDKDLRGVDFLTGFGLRIGAASADASQGGISRLPAPPALASAP